MRIAVVGSVLLVVLAGCSSPTERYCDALRDDRQTIRRLGTGAATSEGSGLQDALDVLQGLREKAPEDIVDEWDTYVLALQGVVDALDEAGIDADSYHPGERPPGVTASQARAVADAARELASPRVRDASQGIEQHAKDVCKVDLGR